MEVNTQYCFNFHAAEGDSRKYVEMAIIIRNNQILHIAFNIYICVQYKTTSNVYVFHTFIAFLWGFFQTTKAIDRQRILEDIQLDLLVIFLSKY